MISNRKARRSSRVRPNLLGFRAMVEAFEKRELLTATGFIQGTVFTDPTGGGVLSSTTTPLANAQVSLYDSTGSTLLSGPITTGSDGNYSFTGLTGGTTYTVKETPPTSSYTNSGAQAISQINQVLSVTSSSIQVTAIDPTTVTANYQGLGVPFSGIYYNVGSYTSPQPPFYTSANQLVFNVTGPNNNAGLNTNTFLTYCVNATSDLANPPTSFPVTVDPPSLLANGGKIAYLDNHYGLPGVTPTSFPAVTTTLSSSLTPPGTIQSYPLSNLLAAVQIAIWDLEYNNGAATGLFNLTGFDPYHTSATDYAEIQDAAAVLVTDATNKSEQVAILNATSGNQSLPATSNSGTQSVLAASTFDFFNKPAVSLNGYDYLVPNTTTSGSLTTSTMGVPIPGTTVALMGTDEFGNPVNLTTTTNSSGFYSFPNLNPSNSSGYTVTETPPAADSHLGQTSTTPGAVTNTPPGTPSVVSNIVLTTANTPSTDNFFETATVSISGVDFLDSNGDCIQQANEPPIAGTTVMLSGTDEFGTPVSTTTTTNASGAYSFPGLNPSNAAGYTVTETVPTGYSHQGQTSTTPGAVTTPLTTPVVSNIVLTTNGSSSVDNFCETAIVKVGDFVWNDLNANGIQNAGEPGINGVTLTLTGTNVFSQPVTDHATTSGNGGYLFTEAPGTYTVTVDASNFVTGGALAGYTATPTLVGADRSIDSNPNPSGTSPSTLAGGGSDLTVDFGYYKPITIGDFVWNDTNANGIQNAGEPGINGVTLTLTGTNGAGMSVTDHATTSGNGGYLFTEAPGPTR